MVQYSKRSLIYTEKKSTRVEQQNSMFSLKYYAKPKRNFFSGTPCSSSGLSAIKI